MSFSCDELQDVKQRLSSCIDESTEKLRRLSEDIWSCAELAYQEHKSHDRLVEFFTQKTGWRVNAHFKLPTAFRATWTPAGSTYDALDLPVQVQVRTGSAGETRDRLQTFKIKVTVLGTPAEEDGGGKIDLLNEGAFDNMDVVFMAHPLQDDAPYLPLVAEHDVIIKYHGKASHASAYSWEGVNALDAAVLCYNSLSVLRQQMKPDWRVHGIIKHGGEKPNIIPAFTQLEYYLGTPSQAELLLLKSKAEGCFRAAAEATGCWVEVEYSRNAFDNILRNKTLEDLYENNGKALGMEFTTDEEVLNNASGSTDFGNVTFVVPGIHPYFYIGSKALNHTEEYTVASGDDRAQFFTVRTAKPLAMTALDVLLRPKVQSSDWYDCESGEDEKSYNRWRSGKVEKGP
uniref:Peptidase M20 domain-containing protein 2 n=1 Tax=Labrus bergylta TaxID=56723 RepID=A0A3Q3GVZ7_9LABR